MTRQIRILAFVAVLAMALLGMKSFEFTSEVLEFLDPATPAWASSGGKKKEKKKKNEHAAPARAEKADEYLASNQREATNEPTPAPSCEGPSLAEQAGLSEQELNVYLTLGQRNKLLTRRENEIATREGLLQVSQQQIDERIKTLEALKGDINDLLGQLDQQEEAQIQTLIKLYDTMKPKPAAQIFAGLDKDVLLQVASRIKADNLAKIMAAMPARKAAELTMAMAARTRLPEKAKDLPGISGGEK